MSRVQHHSVEIEALLDGEVYKFEGREDQRLIETMEEAGMEPPYSCRAGSCGECMCKLEEGSVKMLYNQILDKDDIEQGWILACQSVPTSKRIRISYPS